MRLLAKVKVQTDQRPAATVPEGIVRSRPQYATLQGLRGIAAFWVVLFHAKTLGALRGADLSAFETVSRFLFDYGRGGVAIFFVLSGFVIAHSVADSDVNLRFVGRFALRRSIRLDPPYWISIGLALLFIAYRAAKAGADPGIEWGSVLAHTFYLQEILGTKEIQVVYWTLTYEIQFYLVYILAVWFVFIAKTRGGRYKLLAPTLAAALIAIAFIGALQPEGWAPKGLFVNYWYAFAAGALAYYGGCRKSDVALCLAILLAAAMLSSAGETREVFNSPAAITCMGLAILGRAGRLTTYLSGSLFQKLGSISYSLYLLHVPALVIGISVGRRLFPVNAVGAIGTFALAIASALLLSSLFWWAVERPAHLLAKRLGEGKAARDRVFLAKGSELKL